MDDTRLLTISRSFAALLLLAACSSPSKQPAPHDRDAAVDAGTGDAHTPGIIDDDAGSLETDASADDDAGLHPCKPGETSGCVMTQPKPACGDGLINVAGEECDDHNTDSSDGCTSTCMRDPDYDCPAPGQPCVYTVKCGDQKISGKETCDDGNVAADDGCDASCALTPGWVCPVPGLACQAAMCGDGIVAGNEECDFAASTAGCTDCRIDAGSACDAGGCHATVCGDGKVEHGEQCDDGDNDASTADVPFDGCFACKSEPHCTNGVCTSVCGDGQRFASEDCDDGNLRNGDGCSSACKTEYAFGCTDQSATPPANVGLPILFRDFVGEGNSLRDTATCYNPVTETAGGAKTRPCFHIDFNGLGGNGIAGVVEQALGDNGRPKYVCPIDGNTQQPNCDLNPGHLFISGSRPNFNGPVPYADWYDSSASENLDIVDTLTLARDANSGTYVFDATGAFYPIDGKGWEATMPAEEADASASCKHNVSFTSETHFWFEYQGGERFDFSGDDDLWVFVNGKLAIDLGGLHGSKNGSFVLDADTDGAAAGDTADGTADLSSQVAGDHADVNLGLTPGGVYEVVMFHAERNECGSNFKVTLKDFNRPKSECKSSCGDGKVASDELCDTGDMRMDPPPYGGCSLDCKTRGHFCGDAIPDTSDGEQCDDGNNLTVYSNAAGACAPGCKKPAFCGDGEVQSGFGEQCDDGKNDGAYGKCAPGCVPGPRCGDGKLQAAAGEQCDDGNLENFDGCNVNCQKEMIL